MPTTNIQSWLNEECPELEIGEVVDDTAKGACTLTIISDPQELWVHYQTTETLERFAYKILDAAQKQRDRDGRRALAAGTIAQDLEKYSKPVDHYFIAPADRGDDCAVCGKDIHVHPTLRESAAIKGVQFSDDE